MKQRNTRKTTEEFIEEVKKNRPDIILLDEYPQNKNTKMLVKCKKCDSNFYITPKAILRGTQCPNCRIIIRKDSKTFKTFKEELNEKNNSYKNNLIQLMDCDCSEETIILNNHRFKCSCNECGRVWETTARELLDNHGCDHCNRVRGSKKRKSLNRTLTQEEFIKKLKEKNEFLDPKDDYVNERTKIGFKCKTCGAIMYMTPNEAFSNHGCTNEDCPNNAKERRKRKQIKDTFTFYKEVLEKNPHNWCLEFYTGNKNKIKTKCGKCGYIWYPIAASLLKGVSCPKCGKSAGERRIEKYLEENKIDYIPQKTFDDLYGMGGGLLLYDFYLPTFNLLIEYQGEFHDGSIRDSYQSPEKKQQQFEHDKRKKQYAKNNNIEFLEIWYQDYDNIECIINEKMKEIVNKWLNQY